MGIILRNREEVYTWCESKRQAGAVLVFTNGVFDLLHPGHLDSLRRARQEGDLLVVGVNSDASVVRLKGAGRPILPLEQRLRLLAALEVVDAAAAFEEDTPGELIRAVQPDVLVKGGDYRVEDIVGHEMVSSRGGRTMTMPIIPGFSTSTLINRIKEKFGA